MATSTAVARPDAAAAAAALPWPRARVAHDSLRPVWRVHAARSAVAAPSQRAELAGRGGRSAAGNGRNRRRPVAQAVLASRADYGSSGGARKPRKARSAAAFAAARGRLAGAIGAACWV